MSPRTKPSQFCILLFLIAMIGCGASEYDRASERASKKESGAKKEADGDNQPKDAVPMQRKLIYTSTVEVRVVNLDEALASIRESVERHKGYLAKAEENSRESSWRRAELKVRVPVANYQPMVDELLKLGKVELNRTESQDVTEEYIDLESRLRNLRTEEEAINKLMKEKIASIEELLKVRNHLVEIRGNIERAEGRHKYLATMSAMATINLTLRENKPYVPQGIPSFGEQITTTFRDSLSALIGVGRGLTVGVVAVVPWLPILAVGAWLVRRVVRGVFVKVVPLPPPVPAKSEEA
jgi:hypothetical protein